MNSYLIRVLLVVIGYVFGLFQTGHLYGKLKHVDLHKEGSGNTGATNALRVMGFKSAFIIFFFDMLKTLIPCLAVRILFRGDPLMPVYLMYAGLGALLGNDFPAWLKFKGGKGVAATAGWVIALDWRMTLVGFAVFFSIAFATRYVSLASIIISILLFVMAVVFSMPSVGWIPVEMPGRIEYLIITGILSLLLIWRHRTNIVRLIHGTENRFGKKKKE